MQAMKKASEVLKGIHGNMNADKVADTMDQIHEQRTIADEISAAIASNPYADPAEDVSVFFCLLLVIF